MLNANTPFSMNINDNNTFEYNNSAIDFTASNDSTSPQNTTTYQTSNRNENNNVEEYDLSELLEEVTPEIMPNRDVDNDFQGSSSLKDTYYKVDQKKNIVVEKLEAEKEATTEFEITNDGSSTITTEDIESLVGQMTKEQYDEFVNGINTYYDQQIDYLNNVLDGENGLNALKNQIENLYQMVRSNDVQNQELNRMIQEQFGYLGITSYDELLNLREDTARQTELLQQALDNLINCKNSAKFDYLYYLEDYEAFIPTTVDIDSYIAGVDKECCLNFQNGEPLNLDYKTYSYNQFKQLHPEVSPVQFLLLLNKTNPFGNYAVSDLDNYEQILSIGELSELVPNFAKTYEYLYSTDPDKAAEFLRDCKHEINNCKGQLLADKFLDKLKEANGEDEYLAALANELGVSVQGLKDGINSFNNGMYFSFEAFMTGLGLMEENRVLSEEEYKKMYILQGLLSTEAKEAAGLIYKDESGEYQNSNPSSIIDYTKTYAGALLSNNYEISQGIGNMLPSMLISATCPILGSVIMGFSSGGNAYHSAMVDGSDYLNSVVYGILTGYSEAVTERILGGLPGLSDIEVTSLGTYLQSMGKEGFQEIFQGVLDSLVQAEVLGKPLPNTQEGWEAYFQDLIKQGAYGAVTAGILQSPSILRIMNGNSSSTKVEASGEKSINYDLRQEINTYELPESIGEFYEGKLGLDGLTTEEKIIQYFIEEHAIGEFGIYEEFKNAFTSAAKNGNTDVLLLIDAINKGKLGDISIVYDPSTNQTGYHPEINGIIIGYQHKNSEQTFFHEFGHAMFNWFVGESTYNNDYRLTNEYGEQLGKSILEKLSQTTFFEDIASLNDKYKEIAIQKLSELYRVDRSDYDALVDKLYKENYDICKFDYQTDAEFRDTQKKLLDMMINGCIDQLLTPEDRKILDTYNRIEAFLDSASRGELYSSGKTSSGHGKRYFQGIWYDNPTSSLNEAFADYVAFKTTGNTGALELIKNIVGDEYYSFIEEIYEEIKREIITGEKGTYNPSKITG